MLKISDLEIAYEGRPVVAGFDLEIAPGEIVALIGPSGCGKSSIVKAISGLLPASKGTITLGGEPVDIKKHTLGLVPQNYGLLPWKTVLDNVLLGVNLKKKAFSEERLNAILGRLNILDLKHRHPNALSGGQRQRVAIARAFLLNPDLMLLDEPFSALDAITREECRELFLEMWQAEKTTALLITHDLEEAMALAGKIVVMSAGPGRVLKVYDNPLSQGPKMFDSPAYLPFRAEIRQLIDANWRNGL